MKDIKEYLHLYLGCEAVTVKSKPEIITGHIIDLVNGNFYHAKPILRPLSDMTDAEILFDREITTYHSSNHIEQREREAQRTMWLLKRGFDLFGLIESGLAIDKTKLPTNER